MKEPLVEPLWCFLRDPPTTSGWPDLVEALARLGQTDEARRLLTVYAEEAKLLGHPFPWPWLRDAGDASAIETIGARTSGPGRTGPRPTAKAERLIKTLLAEWAYAKLYRSTT